MNKTQQWNVLSDLWKTKTLSEEQFWFLKNESNEESHINDESKKESRVDDVSSADNRLDAINHLEHVSLIIFIHSFSTFTTLDLSLIKIKTDNILF